ncbi:small integral membrane protein 14 isoform X1 [Hemicordylus capensis]|uniref:small integral membrane protein 14 isoform X1 n=1 Tax=Hemicordylus capensis TaxID=884348 RepID=UPI0023022076|nr:small integral membrane protein 14 isoform X1 [Hemicordylus capensis]
MLAISAAGSNDPHNPRALQPPHSRAGPSTATRHHRHRSRWLIPGPSKMAPASSMRVAASRRLPLPLRQREKGKDGEKVPSLLQNWLEGGREGAGSRMRRCAGPRRRRRREEEEEQTESERVGIRLSSLEGGRREGLLSALTGSTRLLPTIFL